MKKIIVSILMLVSFLGAGVKWVYDEISSLKNNLNNLKTANLKLKEKNKSLVKKQHTIQKKIQQRRVTLENQKLSRAKNKLAKASVSVIPFVGTATVVSLTYDELKDYCTDIQEYKKFESSLFNTTDNTSNEAEQVLCGYNYEAVKSVVLKDIEDYKNRSSNWIDSQFYQIRGM